MLSSMDLSSISNLFHKKERELNAIIGNLQLEDIKSDPALSSTINRVERSLLLEPVAIGDPRITGHRTEQRNYPPHYNSFFGGLQNITLITVEFPCTGSSELFEYRGSGQLTVGSVYVPSGNQISVEVQVSKVDKAEALAKANDEIRITKELIRMNNSEIVNWSESMKTKIKSEIESKRIELKALYE